MDGLHTPTAMILVCISDDICLSSSPHFMIDYTFFSSAFAGWGEGYVMNKDNRK